MPTRPHKKIEYNGRSCTLMELSAVHGVPATTINNRLTQGWDVAQAISVPAKQKKLEELPPEFADGNIVRVIFPYPLGQVFAHMQPRLNKPYIATAHTSAIQKTVVYTITLENGKPLIVYPEEFEIYSVSRADQSAAS